MHFFDELSLSQAEAILRIVREGAWDGFKCEGLSVVFSVNGLTDVGWVGVGEGNSWWLGRFKGVFRYGFGRLDLKDRRFNLIPRGET